MENTPLENKIAIAEIKKDICYVKESFEKFIENDFEHLREKVDQLNRNLIIGAVVLIIAQILLKILGWNYETDKKGGKIVQET